LVAVAAQGVAIVMAKKSAPSAASAAPVTPSQAADAAGRAPSGRRAEPSVELAESTRADMQAAEQLAAELAGIDMDEPDTEKQAAKSAPDEGTQAKPETTSTQADEAFNDDAPVLGDDDEAAGAGEADGAAETDDDDTPSDDDAPEVAALKKENFKQREKKRELEAQLKALADEKAELQRKLSTLETTPTVMPDLGIYAEAKSADEVAKLEDQQQQFADYVESLLDEVQEVYTLATHDGQERDFTRQQLRDYLRGARANVKLADKARNALKISAEAEARAKVKYPSSLMPRPATTASCWIW
jgi:predicted  nucleic acid-binding Zn-ribbon protein